VLASALVLLASTFLKSDVGQRSPLSDFDAEFARAVELLEAGHRPEAEQALEAIRLRSAERAWEARLAFLLAGDDLRRRDFPAAVRRLRLAPAAAVGLEPYRQLLLGRALDAAGLSGEAAREYRAAFETEEPFAARASAGRALAGVLEKRGDLTGASAALSRAASGAGTRSEASAMAAERIRVGLASKDAAAVRAASRDLLFSGVVAEAAPAFARGALRQELARLTPAERGRLGASLVAAGSVERGVRLLRTDSPVSWPAPERAANLLALARGEARLGHAAASERAAAAAPRDGSDADFEARLFGIDLSIDRARRKTPKLSPADPAALAARAALLPLTEAPAPLSVRIGALTRLTRLDCDADRFEDALARARAIERESPGSVAGFEPLWKLAWELYSKGDFDGAGARMSALQRVYPDGGRRRRLSYWRARCLEREGRKDEASPLYAALAEANPPDVYALFARRRTPALQTPKPELLTDPSTATATFRRTDELLRLRMFEEAAGEAAALPVSRGRDLRLAEAQFALGRFPAAAEAARRAFPDLGTASEGRVPDGWRRLFYPIEEKGFLGARAKEFSIDPSLLRALVRQESVFEPRARSRAGALGLTQLMPATAKSLARSVLRARYRVAFLYDPGVNARLGAAYFRRLLDRFGGKPVFALAAYNGGPTRMARVVRENPGREDDEVFESHPAYETRDYVRRVMLYAESYRELYPDR
jgi:soluble lytic murein transglycosylase-like protein